MWFTVFPQSSCENHTASHTPSSIAVADLPAGMQGPITPLHSRRLRTKARTRKLIDLDRDHVNWVLAVILVCWSLLLAMVGSAGYGKERIGHATQRGDDRAIQEQGDQPRLVMFQPE